ncbi:MAG TPA: site-2 protease family protein, partial [Bacillota bacterium]|nr:site-2 protease family protein [Bacillota bacterium]
GQKIRLGFDINGEVTRIVLKSSDPNYHDFHEIKVETFDLTSPEGTRLFINEYTVNRKAMYIMDKKQLQITPSDRSFVNKSKWQRFLATFGGPLMNFILALFVYLIIGFIVGVPNTESNVVGAIAEDSPASEIVGYENDEDHTPITLIQAGDKIVSINGVAVNSWSGDTNSVSSELAKDADSYDIVVERNGELVTLENVIPQWIFYGLGFTSTPSSNELVIGTPLYLDSKLRPGDELISINDVVMNSWSDVIQFATDHQTGSVDENDLFTFYIYRLTTSEISGTVTDISDNEKTGYTDITITTNDGNKVVYSIGDAETIVVSIDDSVEVGTELTSGGYYTFQHLVYGTDVLGAMGHIVMYSRIGISSTMKFSFFGAISSGWDSFLAAGASIFKTLGLLFSSNLVGVSDLSGFVGIFTLTSQAASGGLVSLLSWIGLLSVNLGIINLLPIPALDGGRIVFIGYEAITRRKPNQKVENLLHTVMFFLLMGLLVFITYNDILRLFGLK